MQPLTRALGFSMSFTWRHVVWVGVKFYSLAEPDCQRGSVEVDARIYMIWFDHLHSEEEAKSLIRVGAIPSPLVDVKNAVAVEVVDSPTLKVLPFSVVERMVPLATAPSASEAEDGEDEGLPIERSRSLATQASAESSWGDGLSSAMSCSTPDERSADEDDDEAPRAGCFLSAAIRQRMQLLAVFDVRDYPLDSQAITMNVRLPHDDAIRVIVPIPSRSVRSQDVFEDHVHLTEWKLREPLVFMAPSAMISKARHGVPKPELHFVIPITRRPAHSLYNVASVLFVVVLLALILCMAISEVAPRIETLVGLLLTAASIRQSASDRLPPVPYLTLLDKYWLTCGGVIALLSLQTVLLAAFGSGSSDTFWAYTVDWKAFDLSMLWLELVLWVVGHVLMFVTLKRRLKRRGELLTEEVSTGLDPSTGVFSKNEHSSSGDSKTEWVRSHEMLMEFLRTVTVRLIRSGEWPRRGESWRLEDSERRVIQHSSIESCQEHGFHGGTERALVLGPSSPGWTGPVRIATGARTE
jgi:hypothetical protein